LGEIDVPVDDAAEIAEDDDDELTFGETAGPVDNTAEVEEDVDELTFGPVDDTPIPGRLVLLLKNGADGAAGPGV